MNFLAHQYLSFGVPTIMVGNFIADTVGGPAHLDDKTGVRLGIEIHRAIDEFTDTHPLVLESRKLLYPYFSKYAAVVQDIFYDHFLAVEWSAYSDVPLREFAARVYLTLGRHSEWFNERAQRTYFYMTTQNWLENYATEAGIDRSLKGMAHRAKFHSNMENSLPALRENRESMRSHFSAFFPQLKQAVEEEFGSRASRLKTRE